MSVSSRAGEPPHERFHKKWGFPLWYGTIASLMGHAAVIVLVLSVDWTATMRAVMAGPEPLLVEWLSLLESREVSAGIPEPATPGVTEPEPDPPAQGSKMGVADLLDVLRDQMPVSYSPVVARTAERATEDETTAANGEAAAADLASILGSIPLDLDLLSTVSPELALSIGGADWPLIRNPNQVENFIKSGYDSIYGADTAKGLVTVAMWIDRDGSVEWTEVYESSGYTGLDELAVEVMSQVARFRPVRRQGVSGTLAVLVSIRFPF
ncbi:MAG: TonB family protein [Gemmatimonadetes bacterium]|nr:TonB family protein [Gemmatimonadota bacterium]